MYRPVFRLNEILKNYLFLLSYPEETRQEAEKRFEELRKVGIEALILEGPIEVKNVRILGKGHASLVIKGKLIEGEEVAIKILRTDADRSSLEREAELLRLANAVGVGPRLYNYAKHVIVMELVEGVRIGEWDPTTYKKDDVMYVIRDLLEQCRRLDVINLDHGELSNPAKHVIIGERPVILDFESASLNRRPSNVTSLAQYLFISGPFSDYFRKYLIRRSKEEVIGILRKYKRDFNDEVFKDMLRFFNLLHIS